MLIVTGRVLKEIGELLHGPDWRSWLADRLSKSERTIRRYEKGERRIPRDVRDTLGEMIRSQRTTLEEWERDWSA